VNDLDFQLIDNGLIAGELVLQSCDLFDVIHRHCLGLDFEVYYLFHQLGLLH
jgi:hypothetical protein